jgi:hypothetical protein
MLAQHDGHIAHAGNEAHDVANDVPITNEIVLAWSIELCVIGSVVVTFGEKLEWSFTNMKSKSISPSTSLLREKS